jgi:hypothetical protein
MGWSSCGTVASIRLAGGIAASHQGVTNPFELGYSGGILRNITQATNRLQDCLHARDINCRKKITAPCIPVLAAAVSAAGWVGFSVTGSRHAG